MVIISTEAYFGPHAAEKLEHLENAKKLLAHVNALLAAVPPQLTLATNPKTGTLVSGEKYGGYRPQACPIGAPNSAHKTGEAVDVYDPWNTLDGWLTDERLVKFDLYREHPDYTLGWCHLSTRAPKSGRRTFKP